MIRSREMIIPVMIINDDDNYWRYFDWHCDLLIIFWFWKSWFSDDTIYTLTDCVIIFYQVDYHCCALQQCVWLELPLTFLSTGIWLTSSVKEIHVSRDITYERYIREKFFILRNFCCTYSRSCKINVKSVLHNSHTPHIYTYIYTHTHTHTYTHFTHFTHNSF